MQLPIDKTIFRLLCLYALLVPFELVLKRYFGIDTILKPYRVIVLLLFAVYGYRVIQDGGLRMRESVRRDIYLYLLFGYGFLVSLLNMVWGNFSLPKFYNEVFQTGLYVGVFLIMKNMPLRRDQLRTIFRYLMVGIALNALLVVYNRYQLNILTRQSGLFDNPNYLALAMATGLTYVLVYLRERLSMRWLVLLGLLPLLLAGFNIAGSRGALIVMIAISLVWLTALSWRWWLGVLGVVTFSLLLFLFRTDGISLNTLTGESVLVSRLVNRDAEEDPRFAIWRGVIRAADDNDFIGMGYGQFEHRFSDYYKEESNRVVREVVNYGYHLSPHSDLFSVLITFGVVGLLLYLVFFARSLWWVWLRRRYASDPKDRLFMQLQLLCLLGLFLFGLGAENFVSGIYWLILALSTTGFALEEAVEIQSVPRPTEITVSYG